MDADEKNLSIRSGAFIVVAGLACTAYFGWILFQQSSAADWPTTSAIVVVSDLEVETTVSAKRGVRDLYQANVVYEYVVEGERHRGTELWFDSEPAGTQEDMAALLAEYPVGKVIDVYYDEDQPQRSVVDPSKNEQLARIMTIVGIVIAGVGGFMLYGGLAAEAKEEHLGRDYVRLEDERPLRVRQAAASTVAPTRGLEEVKPIRVPDVAAARVESTPVVATAPKPRRPRHWLVRAVAGILGFPMLLMFGAVTVKILVDGLGEGAKHSLGVTIGSAIVAGGITLFGLWLTICCVGRDRKALAAN